MNLLLDTHTLIWWSVTQEKLSDTVMDLLQDNANTIILSLASIWEMQIKVQRGKLTINRPLPELIASQQQTNNLQLLPIEVPHIFALQNLPDYHRDPFDRIIISQAMVEGLPVLSKDATFDAYPIVRVW
ncbi:MAG: type II toxin-antitoxin system VapC family toxin [Hormoscilla sp. SP5CHS1]|nr:type II toxin-antitoxin system VapC family toxin [Hormoscilla sp. SP5CHS1]